MTVLTVNSGVEQKQHQPRKRITVLHMQALQQALITDHTDATLPLILAFRNAVDTGIGLAMQEYKGKSIRLAQLKDSVDVKDRETRVNLEAIQRVKGKVLKAQGQTHAGRTPLVQEVTSALVNYGAYLNPEDKMGESYIKIVKAVAEKLDIDLSGPA